jgi:hypothetical protein
MTLSNSISRLFQASLFTMMLSFGFTPMAHALTNSFSWTGTNGNSLTGTFTGIDNDSDGFIRGGNLFGSNEVSAFTVTFLDSGANVLITYNLSELLTFSPSFNFNYQLSPATILQSGNSFDNNGFSIGSDSGYLLDTTSGTIGLTDSVDFVNNDSGGTLEVTPIPFEFNPAIGLVLVGSAVALKRLYKKHKKSGK